MESGFTLIGAFVVIVLGALILGCVVYVCKVMIDRARTVESHRQQQMTNELVEPFPSNFPEYPEWTLDASEFGAFTESDGQLAISVDERVFETVGVYCVDTSGSAAGPWSNAGQEAILLTGTVHSVRATLLDLLKLEAKESPFPSCGFYRMTKP